jgi:hypothetical protein
MLRNDRDEDDVLSLERLLLLVRPYPVFYLVCLSSCDVDVQSAQQPFGSFPGVFSFFAISASRLSSILFRRSLHARFLILIHFVA